MRKQWLQTEARRRVGRKEGRKKGRKRGRKDKKRALLAASDGRSP
jgi:hypothetical protein